MSARNEWPSQWLPRAESQSQVVYVDRSVIQTPSADGFRCVSPTFWSSLRRDLLRDQWCEVGVGLSSTEVPAELLPIVSVENAQVWLGDALDVLERLPISGFHAVVCDPPYSLGLNGLNWDDPAKLVRRSGAGQALSGGEAFSEWCSAWASKCLGLLRPGGHLVAFGGTRTWQHLAVGVERAGFAIRDQIAWLYTSGLPKGMDVSAAIDRHLGERRPDRRVSGPGPGSVFGGTRNVYEKGSPVTAAAQRWEGWASGLKPAFEPIIVARAGLEGSLVGNVLAHGAGAVNVDAARGPDGRWPANVALDLGAAGLVESEAQPGRRAPNGGFAVFRHESKAPRGERPVIDGVRHPTVKPLSLMRWLCRLFVPVGGLVLDPFAGSGTTIEAALLEGMRVVGIEREATYFPLIKARIERACPQPRSDSDGC